MNRVAEIGCWKGRSTSALLAGCQGPVYAVDHWRGSENEREGPHREAVESDVFAEFMANVGHYPNLNVRRGDSIGFSERLPLMDMVFIDAGHTYEEVQADLKAWSGKALKLLAGHDYTDANHPGVRRAVDERFGDRVKRGPDSIWYVNNPMPRKVHVATPMFGGLVTDGYHYSMLRMEKTLSGFGVAFQPTGRSGDSLIQRARASLFGQFLSDKTATHLIFIDADIEFDPMDVMALMYADKQIIGGIYPCKSTPITWPMNFDRSTLENLPHDPESGAFEVQDAPTGFLMIRRDAAERMVEEYRSTRCMVQPGGWDAPANANTYNVFPLSIDADGMLLSEDFGFCRLWQGIGGKVWVIPGIELGHAGRHTYRGRLSDTLAKHEDPETITAKEVCQAI